MIRRQHWEKRRGFTLIELMVVVSIIAVLSSVGYVTYSNAQKIARDAKRKQDMKIIQAALEHYYDQNGHYPIHSTPCNNILGPCYTTSLPPYTSYNNWLPADLDAYFDGGIEPNDPIDKADLSDLENNRFYAYTSAPFTGCPAAGQWYVLIAVFDNSNDPLAVGNNPTKWCDGHLIGPTQPSPWYITENAYVIVMNN